MSEEKTEHAKRFLSRFAQLSQLRQQEAAQKANQRVVDVPGEARNYNARYEVRELG